MKVFLNPPKAIRNRPSGLRHASVPSQKIISHAKETLEYLKARENFWRQQQPSSISYAPAAKEKRLGRKIKAVFTNIFKCFIYILSLSRLLHMAAYCRSAKGHRPTRALAAAIPPSPAPTGRTASRAASAATPTLLPMKPPSPH